MLKIGDKAPDFCLPSTDMELHSLSDFADQTLVLYFYPKDDTPGCTVEAAEFTDRVSEFESVGARVVGVSRDDCFSHQAFRDKYGLLISLLADVDGVACEAYGVLQKKDDSGRIGIRRSTFVIDREGVIRFAEYGVSPKGHADVVLEVASSLQY